MKLEPIFLLILCIVFFSNVEDSLARKRNEAFRRCLKQMKTSFKHCFMKLTGRSERPKPDSQQKANETVEFVQPLSDTSRENETVYGALATTNSSSAEERYDMMERLQATLMEKISQVPPGKMQVDLMERFKKELGRMIRMMPEMKNHSDEEPMAKLYDSIIEKLTKEVRELDEQERMHDPKYKKKVEERYERKKLEEVMNKMQETLSTDLEKRSQLHFTENVPNRIREQVANTSSLKEELTSTMVNWVESRDTLEEIKRDCRQIKKIYEVDVSATIDLANYLLQNVDLKIDLMTSVVRVMNHQPNLLSGTVEFDFTRIIFDHNLLPKASAEIYEMTCCFAEMRELHYKIKNRDWSLLANKTGVLFRRLNNELTKQRQRFLMPPSS